MDLFGGGILDLKFLILVAEHPLMMLEYLRWQAFKNPVMLKSLKRSQSVYWVPVKTRVNEVKEILVIASQNAFQSLSQGSSLFTS